jgi:hypothetical protein
MAGSRIAARLVLGAGAALIALGPIAAAHAEGPGYGGTADSLNVAWVQGSELDANAAIATTSGSGRGAAVGIPQANQPRIAPDQLALQVSGLGFRAKSPVTIRVGEAAPVDHRSDTAGAFNVAIDPALLDGTRPGLSVVAIGRNPAGTAVTLFGSVPPEPGGTGPMTLVPWIGLALVLGGLALWLRGRARAAHAEA